MARVELTGVGEDRGAVADFCGVPGCQMLPQEAPAAVAGQMLEEPCNHLFSRVFMRWR